MNEKRPIKIILILVIMASLLATFAACQKEGAGKAKGGELSGTLTIWTAKGPRFELPQVALSKEFSAKHPKVTVNITTTPIGELFPQVGVKVGSGSADYDAVQVIALMTQQFAADKKIIAVEDYFGKEYADDLKSDIAKNFLEQWTGLKDGKLYAVPVDMNTQITYYRKDIFEKEGLSLPTTWDGVLEVAKKLTKDTNGDGKPDQYGATLSMRRGEFAGYSFCTLFWTHGGEWLYPEKLKESNFAPMFNTEHGKWALQWFKKILPYCDPSTLNSGDDEAINAMASGVAVYAPFIWGNPALTNEKVTKFFNVMGTDIPPAGASGSYRPYMGGVCWVVPSASKNINLAVEYMKYVSSREAAKIFVENTGQPCRNSTLNNADLVKISPYFPALAKGVSQAVTPPIIPEAYQILDMVGTEVSLVLTEGKKVEQALASMDAKMKQILTEAGYFK